MKEIVNKTFATLLLTILLSLISVGITAFSDYALDNEHYYGFILILLSTIIYFVNKKVFSLIFTLTLVLGLMRLIDIFYIKLSIGVSIFDINPLFLVLIIVFLALSKEELNRLFPDKPRTD